MPIHSGKDRKGYFYQWGQTGKKYYYDPVSRQSATTAYNKAKKQQTAIYSSGWKGDGEMKMKLIKVKIGDARPNMRFQDQSKALNTGTAHARRFISKINNR